MSGPGPLSIDTRELASSTHAANAEAATAARASSTSPVDRSSSPGAARYSPTTGTKRFDPFAPLPPSHLNQPWSAANTFSSTSALGGANIDHKSNSTSTSTSTSTSPSTSASPSSATASAAVSASSPASSYSNSNPTRASPSPSSSPLLTTTGERGTTAPTTDGASGSGSGRPRPSSLYIPMDDNSSGLNGLVLGSGAAGNGAPHDAAETNGSTWPFKGQLLSSPPFPGPFPLSPSAIHPSYADLDAHPPNGAVAHASNAQSGGFAAAAAAASASALATISGASQHLYSAIPVMAASPDRPSRGTSPTGPSRRAPGNGPSGKHQVTFSSSTSLTNSASGAPRHAQSYSVGTHALLSSRSGTASSRLATRLDTPTAWLVLYFGFNLGLTLFNKLVLQGFPFPWTLTAIQMLSGTIGTQIALYQGYFTQARLTTREGAIMVAFSVLYTVNIAVSNISLGLVTVPFHQVVRAMTPLFTIIISAIMYGKRHSRDTYLSLLPVVAGVAFATYGDYSFTAWGFILTLFGTLLAALKTITTNRVQVGRLKLHPLDLLIRMSPLAFVQCVTAGYLSGELDRVRVYGATEMTRHKAIALTMNGAIAFGLNVVSFTANKKTSALTMTVAANVKQVLTIVLAVMIFNVALNPTNMFGIVLTLCGGAWYATVELKEKARGAQAPPVRMAPNDDEKM